MTTETESKPYANEHAARIRSPGLFVRIRELWRQPKGDNYRVRGIGGPLKSDPGGGTQIQAIRFNAARMSVTESRTWLKKHGYKPILFEQATGKKSNEALNSAQEKADNRREKQMARQSTVLEPAKKDAADSLESASSEAADRTITTEELEPTYISTPFGKNFLIGSKAASPGAKHGFIEGYASVFDVKDRQGEIVRKGAFAKTIADRVNATRKVPLMAVHFARGGDMKEAVGIIAKAEEDDYGLKVRATFLGDKSSQEVRDKLIALLDSGVQVGMSIGYVPKSYGHLQVDGEHLVELKEVALYEVTLTIKPANESALVTGAKDAVHLAHEAMQTVIGADPAAMDSDACKQLIIDVFGARESAEALRDQLTLVVGKIEGLLQKDSKSQVTPTKAGADSSQEPDSTIPKVDRHSDLRKEIEEMRRTTMRESLDE